MNMQLYVDLRTNNSSWVACQLARELKEATVHFILMMI
jgi:hypothetical protein